MSGLYTNGVPLASLPFSGNERLPLDTQLSAGAQPETEAASLAQLASYFGGSVPFATGRFYGLPQGATPGTILTVTGTLYAYPFYISSPVIAKTLGISVTTGQTGGAAHIGLYQDNGAGYPGALVTGSDGAALAATATAIVSNTVNLSLNSGWYWLASIFTATGTFPTVAAVTNGYGLDLNSQLGASSAANFFATTNTASDGISVAATYGTLLSIGTSFPAGGALVTNANVPLIAIGT